MKQLASLITTKNWHWLIVLAVTTVAFGALGFYLLSSESALFNSEVSQSVSKFINTSEAENKDEVKSLVENNTVGPADEDKVLSATGNQTNAGQPTNIYSCRNESAKGFEKVYLDYRSGMLDIYNNWLTQTRENYSTMKKNNPSQSYAYNQQEYSKISDYVNDLNNKLLSSYNMMMSNVHRTNCLVSIGYFVRVATPNYPTLMQVATPQPPVCDEQKKATYNTEYNSKISTENRLHSEALAYINDTSNFTNSGDQVIAKYNADTRHRSAIDSIKAEYNSRLKSISCY